MTDSRIEPLLPLTVIIVSWNVKSHLSQCLKSIYQSRRWPQFVIVIDNASSDGSVAMVRSSFPQAILVANQTNLGFAAAVNQGLLLRKTDYYLVLNPDCYLSEDTLDVCFNIIDSDKSIGVLGCQSRSSDGSTQRTVRRFPGLIDQGIIMLSLHRLLANLPAIKNYLMSDIDHCGERWVDQIQGSFFMISSKAIERVGLFDERYFVWFEEVDYCRRVKSSGYGIFYTSRTHVIHQGAASFRQLSPIKKRRLFNSSLIKYFDKHQPGWRPLILRLLWPISMFFAFVVTIIHLDRK